MEQKPYIYLIEDDELMVGMYARLLKLSGFEVQVAMTGEDAMKQFLEMSEKPAAIVLDIMVPGVSGFEILEYLKKESVLKDVPVIVLSNLFEQSDINTAMRAGAAAYLVKSQNEPDDVVAKIREVLVGQGT